MSFKVRVKTVVTAQGRKRRLFHSPSFGKYITFPVRFLRWLRKIVIFPFSFGYAAISNGKTVYNNEKLKFIARFFEFVLLSGIVYGAAGHSRLASYRSGVIVVVHAC